MQIAAGNTSYTEEKLRSSPVHLASASTEWVKWRSIRTLCEPSTALAGNFPDRTRNDFKQR